MLEITEMVPMYNMVDSEVDQTPNAFYAKNQDAVFIFQKFADNFFVYVDDYGRLICCEKEKK